MKLMFRMHVHEHGGVKSKDYEREGSREVRNMSELGSRKVSYERPRRVPPGFPKGVLRCSLGSLRAAYVGSRPHIWAQGMRVWAHGLHIWAKGLQICAQGLQTWVQGLHIWAHGL